MSKREYGRKKKAKQDGQDDWIDTKRRHILITEYWARKHLETSKRTWVHALNGIICKYSEHVLRWLSKAGYYGPKEYIIFTNLDRTLQFEKNVTYGCVFGDRIFDLRDQSTDIIFWRIKVDDFGPPSSNHSFGWLSVKKPEDRKPKQAQDDMKFDEQSKLSSVRIGTMRSEDMYIYMCE